MPSKSGIDYSRTRLYKAPDVDPVDLSKYRWMLPANRIDPEYYREHIVPNDVGYAIKRMYDALGLTDIVYIDTKQLMQDEIERTGTADAVYEWFKMLVRDPLWHIPKTYCSHPCIIKIPCSIHKLKSVVGLLPRYDMSTPDWEGMLVHTYYLNDCDSDEMPDESDIKIELTTLMMYEYQLRNNGETPDIDMCLRDIFARE